MITIKEVAEFAKVSQSTVSRALNGHKSVKEANRVKVFEAIEKLGYQPNAFAQALASNKSFSIGMLVGTLDGPFYGPMMHNAEKAVRKENYHLIITSGNELYDQEQDSIQFLCSKKVDGLILVSDMLSDGDILNICEKTPATMVLNRYIPEISNKCITIDNELGGFLAVEHLIEKGHTKIGCITGQLSKVDSRDRLQGYRNALAKHGIEYDPNLVVEGRFDHKGNNEAITRLLDRDLEMTAIFCMNDNIAVTAYSTCLERGMKIGQDISIVGYDNVSYSQHMNPGLTTIDFPVKEMAIQGAEGVLSILAGKEIEHIETKLSPKLIERGSVKDLTDIL
ncbi:LacI family DNA-binding transcriptional regulator [Vibrio hannami]|uniref:LacI family DNA-binding transcriptional regulator n=1 Tax=Vibrio hannami TaxID=2717094 RepID=UPI0024108B0E|nr:LacI family DNA-binding transcriptional regulator [Vibrio hannami]MDG3086046.1 LacI family DNA-binding transcriptional regulator [Vibrio hannami]